MEIENDNTSQLPAGGISITHSGKTKENVKITQPSPLETATLGETFRQSVADAMLLCFFAVVLSTMTFLKFFRTDI